MPVTGATLLIVSHTTRSAGHMYSTQRNADDEGDGEGEEGIQNEETESGVTGYGLHPGYRPHATLNPAGLSIPPSIPFAPLAKLNSQTSSAPSQRYTGTGAPYVYSPQTVPTPPPPPQGYMHPHIRMVSQRPPEQAHQGGQDYTQPSPHPSEFMVLRPDRRTGNLQVAGASQSTHAGAVQAMRQYSNVSNSLDISGTDEEPYHPRAPVQPGSYVCSAPGCGKTYTFASNLRRHVRTAHPEIAFQKSGYDL